jgi:hypothetical protein
MMLVSTAVVVVLTGEGEGEAGVWQVMHTKEQVAEQFGVESHCSPISLTPSPQWAFLQFLRHAFGA